VIMTAFPWFAQKLHKIQADLLTGANSPTYLRRALCFVSCAFSGAASCDLGAKAKPARHIWSASSSLFFFFRVCP